MQQWMDHLASEGNNGETMENFRADRNKLIERCIENHGKIGKNDKDVFQEVVTARQTQASHDKHRGRCVSVEKYKKETGKSVDPKQVVKRKNRHGKTVDCVKIYAHSDSDSWSFEDSEADIVMKDTTIDDGSLNIIEDQATKKYEAATKLAFGKSGGADLTMAKHMEMVTEHGKVTEEKKRRLERYPVGEEGNLAKCR